MMLIIFTSLLMISCDFNPKEMDKDSDLKTDNLYFNKSLSGDEKFSIKAKKILDEDEKIDSLVVNYYNLLMSSNNKNLNTLSFSDSLFDFVVMINKDLQRNKNSIGLYLYLINIESFLDGISSEYVSDMYSNLFDSDALLFYQVLYKRNELLSRKQAKDLSLQLELVGQKCANKESELAGYIDSLQNKHILLVENKSMESKVKEVFRFIKQHYL